MKELTTRSTRKKRMHVRSYAKKLFATFEPIKDSKLTDHYHYIDTIQNVLQKKYHWMDFFIIWLTRDYQTSMKGTFVNLTATIEEIAVESYNSDVITLWIHAVSIVVPLINLELYNPVVSSQYAEACSYLKKYESECQSEIVSVES